MFKVVVSCWWCGLGRIVAVKNPVSIAWSAGPLPRFVSFPTFIRYDVAGGAPMLDFTIGGQLNVGFYLRQSGES